MQHPLTVDILSALVDGNIGAMSVINKIVTIGDYSKADRAIRNLIEYKIMGPMIWVGYKDYCDHDIKLFVDKLVAIDKDMFNFIEKERQCIS